MRRRGRDSAQKNFGNSGRVGRSENRTDIMPTPYIVADDIYLRHYLFLNERLTAKKTMLARIIIGPIATTDKPNLSAKNGKTAKPAMALAIPIIMDNKEYCLIFRLIFLATAAGTIIMALVRRVPPTLIPKATTAAIKNKYIKLYLFIFTPLAKAKSSDT